jgi:hypothetical protein
MSFEQVSVTEDHQAKIGIRADSIQTALGSGGAPRLFRRTGEGSIDPIHQWVNSQWPGLKLRTLALFRSV